jgi:hypothetical protein
MGDCFTSETIDITTTHVILPNDDPHMTITLDPILGLIYGWFVSIIDKFLIYRNSIGEIKPESILRPRNFRFNCSK